MRALFLTLALSVLALSVLGMTAQAQDLVPDRHVAISRDVDFPGGDLQSIFDTTLDACQNACLAGTQCTAFTFNQRSNACFLKSGATDVQPYAGAISARVYPTDPAVLQNADRRAADLDFLDPADLESARQVAADIGQTHATDETLPGDLLIAARARQLAGDTLGALRLTGAAVAVTDAPDLWLQYAALGRDMPQNSDEQRQARDHALPATINAYLRALDDDTRATALADMARTLEIAGRGPDMIPALRLAQDIQFRRDTETLLDAAIAKYGFQVTDTQVESDSATPRICAVFNQELVKAGVDYAPFVQLADPKLTVTVNDAQLCIDGVAHGQRYRVVLREGLPAASGEKLARPVELTAYVRDRSPAVRFTSRAYVLPRTGDIALPIETVNLDEVTLKLRRFSERNIIRTMQEGLFNQPLYQWNEDYFADQMAEDVWTGTATVQRELNRDMLTRVPLAEALQGAPAGVYVLSASYPGADPYDKPAATQWFILSDLGVATMLGTDGLTVMVRGLGDASVTPDAKVTLLSEANAVLGTATTDAAGVAHFAPGLTRGLASTRPALVVVEKADDMAFLSLTDAAFDLSDRGVEGREPAGPIDVFLTTDRGAYRAGETIYLTALMRDAQALALPGVPLTAILSRPDGVEYSRITDTNDSAGGHVFAMPVAGNAPRGTWQIAVKADTDAPALATRSVLVEDFLPERIDFTLALPDVIRIGDMPTLTIDATYLFGPKAADLAIEGEALLRPTDTLAAFPGYKFGRYDDPVGSEISYLNGDSTDADGQSLVPIDLPQITAPGRPLELRVTARLSEGSGRPVERRLTAPVLPDGPMIGIKPAFDDLGENSRAEFALIGLAPDLTPAAMQVKWTLNRVNTRYTWYSLNGNWNWEPVTTRERVATGTATLGDSPVTVGGNVKWGRYEIVVERTDGIYVASAIDFYAGWYAPADASATPDLLDASLDKPAYAIGDTATFRIVPREAGVAVVTVMSNHLIYMESVPVTAGETLIPLTVTDEWGAGAYVTATVIRPMDAANSRNPSRALGLGYATVDPGQKALDVSVTWNPDVQPRGPLDAVVQVKGVAPGDTAYVTLAAVDVGILNLTAFPSPDPQDYYFGQRKLGMELRDVYGRLIDGMNGAMGTVRSGGDAMAQMGLQSPPPTEELVAYFSGPVTVDANGQAAFQFDLPAFNGTVRLMAVAWSGKGVGQAAQDVIVRDPVVVTASVPRFLAPGDTTRMLLEIVHADGPAGEMKPAVSADGLALDTSAIPATFTLTTGGKQTFRLPFGALDPGTQSISVTVTTPDGRELTKTLTVPVMLNDPEISRQSRFTLAAGDTFSFDDQVFTGLVNGTGSATLSVGPLARFDAPGLLASLDRYPYGCTEQITSRALPLLYFNDVAVAMGLATDSQLSQRIDEAIQSVLANQSSNGAFGLWYPDSGDLWLDAYVTDFLSQAKRGGHRVPDITFANAIDNLRNQVNYAPDFDSGGQELSYALMVLAREGAAQIGDLRYYADEKAAAFTTPLGAAQLGAALAFYGDQTRADTLFAKASEMMLSRLAIEETAIWRTDYGTNRRDTAAVLALAVAAGSTAVDRDTLERRLVGVGSNVSTQEATWTLLAANALIRDLRATGLTIDGAPPVGPLVRVRDDQTAIAPVLVANTGQTPTELTVTTFGVPATNEPAGGNGYAIQRDYYTLDGTPASLDNLAIGTRLVTVLTVQPFGMQEARLMVADPLPAGFEIDNPNLIQGGDIRALDWLDPVQGQNAEFRSDRFLAAVDWRSDQPFRLAYIVRAVSPGAFHHPAASVEDMYRPQMRARTDAGQITVAE